MAFLWTCRSLCHIHVGKKEFSKRTSRPHKTRRIKRIKALSSKSQGPFHTELSSHYVVHPSGKTARLLTVTLIIGPPCEKGSCFFTFHRHNHRVSRSLHTQVPLAYTTLSAFAKARQPSSVLPVNLLPEGNAIID